KTRMRHRILPHRQEFRVFSARRVASFVRYMFQTGESRLIDVKLSKIASYRSCIASLPAAPVRWACPLGLPSGIINAIVRYQKTRSCLGPLKPPAWVNHSFRWHPESR
uniref:hypothetical protein n=1 Tax=Sphingomonas sp. TaxID=28214 RepID=UPI0025DF68F2